MGANSYTYNQTLQQEFFNDELNALLSEEEEEEEEIDQGVFLSTRVDRKVTSKNNKQRFIKKSDKGEVEMEIEEGRILNLVIDGGKIPLNQLEPYEELIKGIINEMEAIPKAQTPLGHKDVPSSSTIPVIEKKHKKTITTKKIMA